MLRRTCFLHPVGSMGHVMCILWCVQDAKHQRTIFLARVGLVWIPKKCIETRYTKLVFLPLVGYAGDVEHSDAAGA
jgi:hypothetical protein